jgi:phage protein D
MSDFTDITTDTRPSKPPPASKKDKPKIKEGSEVINNAVSGAILKVKIIVENWDGDPKPPELDCGTFEIDTVDFSGPPDQVSIKALSTPISTGMRREEKSRAKEDTTLREWAQMIADDAKLELMYEVDGEIQLDRIDQIKKSDMAFLLELCKQYGISLKVTNEILVLFEESAYEAKDVIDTFDKSETGGRLIDYQFSQNTGDTVCKVIFSYKDPKSGQLVQAEFVPDQPPATGQKGLINARPGNLGGDNFREGVNAASGNAGDTGYAPYNNTADDYGSKRADKTDNAMRQAKAIAREKNKMEWTCTLRMIGNVKMVGGVNIQLTNFGVYSGKYSVDEATHAVGGGYTTTVKAHKVLVGY